MEKQGEDGKGGGQIRMERNEVDQSNNMET